MFYKKSDAFKNIGNVVKNVTSDFINFDKYDIKVKNKIKNNKIFVVHGRDENILLQLKEFLNENNFIPIVLKDEAKDGKTIIEKIEELTDVSKAIIIYTPDDSGNLGVKIEKDGLNKRARQNVIFEHGYLCSKIGRENVICMVKDEASKKIELPSDINGLLYIVIDNNGGWKYELLKELNKI